MCFRKKNTFLLISYLPPKYRSLFSENRLSQKDAKLYACLISWLGACLQVRCPVWRLQLTKEHSTRAPHKRAQHTRATQKETHGCIHGRRYERSDRDAGAARRGVPPPHRYCCCDISRVYPCISFCVARVCCALSDITDCNALIL